MIYPLVFVLCFGIICLLTLIIFDTQKERKRLMQDKLGNATKILGITIFLYLVLAIFIYGEEQTERNQAIEKAFCKNQGFDEIDFYKEVCIKTENNTIEKKSYEWFEGKIYWSD